MKNVQLFTGKSDLEPRMYQQSLYISVILFMAAKYVSCLILNMF